MGPNIVSRTQNTRVARLPWKPLVLAGGRPLEEGSALREDVLMSRFIAVQHDMPWRQQKDKRTKRAHSEKNKLSPIQNTPEVVATKKTKKMKRGRGEALSEALFEGRAACR